MGLFLAALGATALGAVGSAIAGNEAADAVSDASAQNSRDSRYQFDRSIELTQPWRQSGIGALNLQNGLLGVAPADQLNSGPAATAAQSTVAPNFAGYVSSAPDLANAFSPLRSQDMQSIAKQGYDTNGDGRINQDEFGRFHWGTFGQAEGRSLPQPQNAFSPAPAAAGGTTGGTAGPSHTAAVDPYETFKDSAFYMSNVALTQQGQEQITGQMGAAGKSLSGRHMTALADHLKAREANAFSDYYSALTGLSGTGANLSANSGAQGIAVQGQINQQNTNAAVAQGSAYTGTANAFNNALQNGTDLYAYKQGSTGSSPFKPNQGPLGGGFF